LASSDDNRLRKQIEEFLDRREYDAALRAVVREADQSYQARRYAQGVLVLGLFIHMLEERKVVLWALYIGAYQKMAGLDHQLGDKSATIRDLIQLSRYCIKDGDFDKALAASNNALSVDARSTDALNQKARVLAYRRDYAQAFKVLDQSLEISPGNPRTLYLKASTLGNNGKFADALAVYEQVRMIDPAYPGLGKALAEMRRQINWKVKAVEGPSSGMRPSQGSELDRVPAIQRKISAAEPEEGQENALEALYDEAVVGDGGSGDVSAEALPAAPVEQEPFTTFIPDNTAPPAAEPEPTPEVGEAESGQPRMQTIPVPHQAWMAPEEETGLSVRRRMGSEAEALTVLSPEELRLASLRGESGGQAPFASEQAAVTQPSPGEAGGEAPSGIAGQSAEQQLVGVLKAMNDGSADRETLMRRVSQADGVMVPLSLGILYFNFVRNPQDVQAMTDLLAWLAHAGYTHLPVVVVEEAVASGAGIDLHDPRIAGIVLGADGADMSVRLRASRAELLLERGDTSGYVREELAMLRQAAGSVSAEGTTRQLFQILTQCIAEESCVSQVLGAAGELGVLGQLLDRASVEGDMAKVPALEAAIVERLGQTGVDESTFLGNEELFRRVTLGTEKSAVLRRILAHATNPTVRRKALQSLLVLGTPNVAEFTELVGLMTREHDTTGTAYLIQYLVDHHNDLTDGRFLLEKLGHLAPADFESSYGLGLAAEQLGVHDAAAGYFVAAIRAHPGDPDTLRHALEAILASGDYDLIDDAASLSQLAPADVEGMMDKIVAVRPELVEDAVEKRLVSAWTAYAGARYEEAVAACSGTVRTGGDPRFYVPMALAFVRLGLPELAIRELDHAAHRANITDGARLILQYHAAVIQLGQGNFQQASELLQEIGEKSPGFRDTEELLSKCGSQGSRIVKL